MTDLMKIVLLLSVSGTALAAALALLRRILKEKLPKAVFYYLWLLVLLRLIVPVALPVPGLELAMESPKMEVTAPPTVENRPSDVVQIPVQVNPPATQTAPSVIITDGNGQTQAEPPQTPWYEDAWTFLCEHFAPIWLIGAALHFLWFAVSYFRFCRSLKQDCAPLLEHEQALLDNLRGEVRVAACRSPLARTPMLLGLIRPRIVLPDAAITTRELECILRHELTHLGRRDLWYKWFTVAVTSVHWFNPLMPWLRKEISRACELSCDEGVIRVMDDEHKRLYGETLLALAAANALPRAVPATTLCEEKKQLKERLLGIKKYKKATLLMVVLSVALALLVAGCAAVLGPQMQKNTFTGPLSEAQQAPVLENIKAWAEKNIEVDGEITVTYSEPNDQPQSMGILAEIATTHLYDLSSDTIRPVDGIYPDSERLGHMTLMVKDGETVRDIHVFYLTNGDPAKGTSPVESLEQFAIAYPDAKAKYVSWEQRDGQPLYIKIFFNNEGREDIFEYSGVCGRWGVREKESVSSKKAAIPAKALPQMMESIVQWQTVNGGETDGQTFSLVNGHTLESLVSHDILYQFMDDWETVQIYNIATGDIHQLEGDYTGAVEYGYFSLLNVEEPRKWVFLIDNNDQESAQPEQETALTGQVAVLTKNAPLDNAFVQTVDTEGRTVVMDMAMALKKGDLVYVESQEGETCNVTVLAGEPPRPQGQLDESILATDIGSLQEANQVILKDAKMWAGDPDEGVFSDSTCTGVANVEKRETVTRDTWSPEGTVQIQEYWLLVTLPGGDNAFWVRQEDVAFLWPLSEPLPVWLPADADPEATITSWTYGESNGQPQIVVLEVNDPPAHRAWAWDAFSGSMAERTARNTRDGGDLKVSQLPGVLNGLKTWLDENEPLWQADRTLTFVHRPPTGYKRSFSKEETVLVYSLADGRVTKLESEYTGSENYGLLSVTVNGSKTNLPYYLFIDDAPAAEPVPDLSGKVFVYEKEGFGGKFTISLQDDGTFSYYEGLLSSHLGWGTWTVEDDTLTLREDTFSRVFHFRIEDDSLYYIKKSSSPFTYVQLGDSARFLENGAEYAAALGYDEVRWERRPDGSLGSRFLLARKGEHWGLLDGQGNTLLSPEAYQLDAIALNTYEEVWPIISVSKDGLYGAIDYNGNLVIEPQWQEVRMYCYDQPNMVFLRDGYQWYGVRLSYARYTDVYTYSGMQVSQPFEALHLIPEFQSKTAAWLEQEFHRVYDPWYDIQSLTISDWQESGNEATFHYKKEYLYYNRDPDTVPYILEAKARSQSSYERLYQDYLALKESNYSFKIVWNGDKPTLYSDVSVEGVPEWQPVKIDDYILPWEDPEDSRKIFGEILWNAYLKGELYDGSKLDWTSTEGAAENYFAVTDIDGDGREELLLSWTNASTAGHCFVIYGCWRGAVYTQFTGFPSLRFYDNAAIEEEWSHNQGWSGRFWPHYAYRYNPQSDLYEQVGFVEGWDKQLQPEGFPDDLDADGDGLVYDVRPADFDWTGSRYAPERMMDGPAFEEWRQTYLNGAQQVELELLPLTEENIAALGAPKPNVPEVKPVG